MTKRVNEADLDHLQVNVTNSQNDYFEKSKYGCYGNSCSQVLVGKNCQKKLKKTCGGAPV